MTDEDWRGGLAPHYDFMLTERPENPDMRESASIWLYEENGEFAFPRIGIEAVGATWENHRFDANFAFPDGRALCESTTAPTQSPIAADGKPRILGAGGLAFECLEPYRKWRVTYDGGAVDTTTRDMILKQVDRDRRTGIRFDAELTMVTPCWVQDNTPERLATMTEKERVDAGLMGFGYRMEHLFRAEGELQLDGQVRSFKALGSRIHRQSVRPLEEFRGHCWQSAVFPDGRAFGYIAYPPRDDGSTYNEGYIYQDGKMYPAQATKIPFLRNLMVSGDDVSLELESELGKTCITASTAMNTFKVGSPDTMGLTLQQGGTLYDWDGQKAWGMIERSSPVENTQVSL